MALKIDAEMVFKGYDVQRDGSVLLHFTCEQPGPNQSGEYAVEVSAADLTNVRAVPQFIALVKSRLHAELRPSLPSSLREALDDAVGRAFTV